MRAVFRLILSVILVMGAVLALSSVWQARQERERLLEELNRDTRVLSDSFRESIRPVLAERTYDRLKPIVEEFSDRERLLGISIHDASGAVLAASPGVLPALRESPLLLANFLSAVLRHGHDESKVFKIDGQRVHAYAAPFRMNGGSYVQTVFHGMRWIDERVARIWKLNLLRWLVLSSLVSLTAFAMLWLNVLAPIRTTAEWMKRVRLGENPPDGLDSNLKLLGPVAREATQLARSLAQAREAAEAEARLRNTSESLWTPERLKEFVRIKLGGRALFAVSNREPYQHQRKGKEIEWSVPPSGLVTAIEPVLKACGGTWVAEGSGDADRETVDENDRLRVPPDEPQYTLRRVWLTKEEEEGYYYGFSNEGLWPLCHIAHTRPTFREKDWLMYEAVNRKFAAALLEEMEGSDEPCVLIQDYHFALLPKLIKQKRPDARVTIFWHIPWPNPESFGICPWQQELLAGMLGADIVGFHTQYHCNNFLQTVDRFLESRIDYEHFTVNREGHTTAVKPFPISIAFLGAPENGTVSGPAPSKEELLKPYGIEAGLIGVGVDRLDYTKGILERFLAVETFLEQNPDFKEHFTFVELAAPSRSLIPKYQEFVAEVEREAERINDRLKTKNWKPILLLKKNHSQKDIAPFYRVADLCMVTSLHDGMNLVAKEYVTARHDEQGVLILSQFTGAARELKDALIVNPYDIGQTAQAIRTALRMPIAEQRDRMARMRTVLKERNIFRWAADLVGEVAEIRIEPRKAGVLM